MMKKNLKFIVPVVVLLFAAAAYKLVLAKPAESKVKVHGEVYVLPKEFVINLSDGRFAKLGVGLVLKHGTIAEATAAAGHGAKPPEGYGILPQEPLLRDIVVDTVTDGSADALVSKHGREELKHKILKRVKKKTDVPAEHVVFTDISVQ